MNVRESKQRSVIITEEVWVNISFEAVEQEKSISKICTVLLIDHFDGLQNDRFFVPKEPNRSLPRKTRSVYIPTPTWKKALLVRLYKQHKSASALLEQLLRKHLNMNQGNPIDI